MAISKEKMDSINKDFEKLNANLEGLSKEELKEVAAGLRLNAALVIRDLVEATGYESHWESDK